jgi:hypothetical protein
VKVMQHTNISVLKDVTDIRDPTCIRVKDAKR